MIFQTQPGKFQLFNEISNFSENFIKLCTSFLSGIDGDVLIATFGKLEKFVMSRFSKLTSPLCYTRLSRVIEIHKVAKNQFVDTSKTVFCAFNWIWPNTVVNVCFGLDFYFRLHKNSNRQWEMLSENQLYLWNYPSISLMVELIDFEKVSIKSTLLVKR